RAIVRMDLAAFDTQSQSQLWHETYTGTASASAPSVIDSAYERTLKIAFTNLLNQIRQDNSLLQLAQLSQPALTKVVLRPPPSAPPAVPPPPPSPTRVASLAPGQTPTEALDTKPPRIMLMSPAMPSTREMMTIEPGVAIIGLILGTS